MKIELTVDEFKELFIGKDELQCNLCEFKGWNKEHLKGHKAVMH